MFQSHFLPFLRPESHRVNDIEHLYKHESYIIVQLLVCFSTGLFWKIPLIIFWKHLRLIFMLLFRIYSRSANVTQIPHGVLFFLF